MGSGLLRCCAPSNDKTFNHGHRKRSRAIQSNINHDSFNNKLDLEELDATSAVIFLAVTQSTMNFIASVAWRSSAKAHRNRRWCLCWPPRRWTASSAVSLLAVSNTSIIVIASVAWRSNAKADEQWWLWSFAAPTGSGLPRQLLASSQ